MSEGVDSDLRESMVTVVTRTRSNCKEKMLCLVSCDRQLVLLLSILRRE